MASEDGYGDSNWPVFTTEDFDAIDKICENQEVQGGQTSGSARPQIEIEVELPADDVPLSKADHVNERGKKKNSLYELFRRRGGFLSVTDCTGPSWCEVQYDYGLRQRRSKPLKSRPTSFKTEKGKEIVVEKKAAEKREKIVTAGTAVHKILEKEQKLEEISIRATCSEEFWALRILDFLTRMNILEQDMYCREIGVWGIVQDQVVFGCIDELRLIPNPGQKTSLKSSPSKKGKAPKIDPKQRTIHDMMTNSSSSPPPPPPLPDPEPSKVIQIIDTKTRGSNNIPIHADTLPSRLQLMLYHQLFVDILRADPILLLSLFERLNCDPARPFTERFKADMKVMLVSNDLHLRFLDAGCLLDMLEPMQESIEALSTRKVADSLSLVYRRRDGAAHPPKAGKSPGIARKTKEGEGEPGSPSEPTLQTSGESPSRKRKHDELRNRESSDAKQTVAPTASSPESESKEKKPQALDKALIGTKKFKFNSELLDKHMKSILQWWYGERPSVGVSLENTNRCGSCEYRDGCEWREAKAREFDLGKKKS
ncbi:hypothetical protein SCHPADRAFT_932722 [Schizopora paradoxa]|uniref:Exonuclease V n=1 Tax=Schizopora paradoxa TaxID=27342 RepID=A0A0H2RC18_9AGAM|nr:hypothetical protein SCHPADRAFT_932722 [Schizopora paradoxa]